MAFGFGEGLALVSTLSSVAGMATKGAGQLKGGQATQKADLFQAAVARRNAQVGRYNAKVDRNNAEIAKQTGEYAQKAGNIAAGDKSMEGRFKAGTVLAKQGANNIDVNTGSAVKVRAGQREASQLDAENVLHKAELTAWGYRNKATDFESKAAMEESGAEVDDLRARMAEVAGEDAVTGSQLGAAGSFLQGASALPLGKVGGWLDKQIAGSGGGSSGGGAAAP